MPGGGRVAGKVGYASNNVYNGKNNTKSESISEQFGKPTDCFFFNRPIYQWNQR